MEKDLVEEFYFNRTTLYTELHNLIKENSKVELECIENINPDANMFEEHSYFYLIKENPKNKPWIKRFLVEFMPVYEKLTLYIDFYELRCKTISRPTFNIETLIQDYCMVGKELLLNKTDRVKVIQSLDLLELEKKEVSKDKLLYLANHTPSTWEIYDLLKIKMLNNPMVFPLTSTETYENLTRFFLNLEELMDKVYVTDINEMIPFDLSDVLVLFYDDFREVMDAMKGRRIRIKL